MMPGIVQGHEVTVQDVFEAVGACNAGKMSEAQLHDLEDHACPGAGACGGQFTANTMAMAFEVLGISPMGSSMVPAMNGSKGDVARAAGGPAVDTRRRGQRPGGLITIARHGTAIRSGHVSV